MKLLKITLPLVLILIVAGLMAPHVANAQDPEPEDPLPLTATGLPPGYTIVEGDIIARPGQTRAVSNTNLWPNGIVPFEWDPAVTGVERLQFAAAMFAWEEATDIDFVLRTDETAYVTIIESEVDNTISYSEVGYQGEQQFIIVGIEHWDNTYTLVHELGHTLGLRHEHTRIDREDFITVNEGNIDPDFLDLAFGVNRAALVYPKSDYESFGLAGPEIYDFQSVMHYGDNNFCIRNASNDCIGDTISVNAPWTADWQDAIGQRNRLSDLDILSISFLYQRSNWFFVDSTHSGTESGTFIEPYDTFQEGVDGTSNGGRLHIQPGNYAAVGTYSDPMTLDAPLGHVTLGGD
ncbi:MAG: M12 family metallopeptidase [Anaerolineae bacterium]